MARFIIVRTSLSVSHFNAEINERTSGVYKTEDVANTQLYRYAVEIGENAAYFKERGARIEYGENTLTISWLPDSGFGGRSDYLKETFRVIPSAGDHTHPEGVCKSVMKFFENAS